jgi:heat shock protein HslJ
MTLRRGATLRAMRAHFALGAFVLLIATIVAACGGSGDSPTLPGTSWIVTSINRVPTADPKPTIDFGDDGSVSGNTTCNQYSGTYTVDGDNIDFSPLASTMMACTDPALSAQESIFIETVQGSTFWAIDGGNLSLTGEKNLVGEPAS